MTTAPTPASQPLPHQPSRRCVAILGGSFDPVHAGHVALANYFVTLLAPDELRVIPAGNPWQKHGLEATPKDRVEMVKRAFSRQTVPLVIDEQEIRRDCETYTIDTLKHLRNELGKDTSLVFLMGADQLLHLNTWQGWNELFDYAHLCVASRPGFTMAPEQVPLEVTRQFMRRAATPEHIRQSANGLTYIATNLAVDISATEIRTALHNGGSVQALLSAPVLDYIQQHHLYQS
jgi:nicotinate-nucleotide adenylyltransferase